MSMTFSGKSKKVGKTQNKKLARPKKEVCKTPKKKLARPKIKELYGKAMIKENGLDFKGTGQKIMHGFCQIFGGIERILVI